MCIDVYIVATPRGVTQGILGIRDAGWGKGVLLSFFVGVNGFGVCARYVWLCVVGCCLLCVLLPAQSTKP